MIEPRFDWSAVWAVVRRDLRIVRSSKAVAIPMVAVPVLLLVALPIGMVVMVRRGTDRLRVSDLGALVDRLPADVGARVTADPVAGMTEILLVYLLTPFLLILPLMVASVIAADSIAGERERRTLEALLATPLTDSELFAAKLLGAMVPAVTIGVGGGVVYAVVADVAAAGLVDARLFPNVVWAGLVLWLGPAMAAISLGITVQVSARVQGTQEAFQIGGIIVVPVVALLAGQAAGFLVLSPLLLVISGAFAWLVAAVVLHFGERSVRRTRLGERL
jgi:ABC-2 type transport system permease protein